MTGLEAMYLSDASIVNRLGEGHVVRVLGKL